MARRFVLPAMLTAALPLLAADALGVRPGLWETTFEVSGPVAGTAASPTMPPGAMNNMGGGMAEHTQRMGSRAPPKAQKRKMTERSCVTEQQLQDGVFLPARDRTTRQCRYELVSASAQRQEMTMSCDGAVTATGQLALELVDAMNVRGNMSVKTPQSDLKMKFQSRWLQAACDEGVVD